MPPKIPVYLFHGTLGSGKTTLIRHLLTSPRFTHAIVVENEYAPQGVDGTFLKEAHTQLRIYEINGSCVCCTGTDELLKTLIHIREEHGAESPIILETTGVAQAIPLLHTLLLDETFQKNFVLEKNIFVMDALERKRMDQERLAQEGALADIVAVTKSDLLALSEAENLRLELKTRFPHTPTILVEQGVTKLYAFFDSQPSKSGEALLDIATTHLPQHSSPPDWRVFKLPSTLLPEDLVSLMAKHVSQGTQVLRIKGYMQDARGIIWRIDGTPEHIAFHRPESPPSSHSLQVVLIGYRLPPSLTTV